MTAFDIELAPYCVVRIAAWPVQALDPFRSSTLGDDVLDPPGPPTELLAALHAAVPTAARPQRRVLLETARRLFGTREPLPSSCIEVARWFVPGLEAEQQRRRDWADRRQAYQASYQAAVQRSRQHLQRLPESFLKALAVARPDIDPERRSRRTEATLYHFLCRAAGRPTPHALWAGCRLSGDSQGPQARFTPQLSPFRRLIAGLGTTRPVPLRLNPTLYEHDGYLHYRVEQDNGWTDHRVLLDDALREALRAPLSDTGRDGLVAAGLVWPVLDLPAVFGDAWEALEAVPSQLAEPERTAWQEAVDRLRHLCDKLSSEYDRWTLGEVRQALDEAQETVQDLYRKCGAGQPVGPFLWADLRPPFTIMLDPTVWEQLREAVERALDFYGRLGSHEPATLAIPARLQAACPDGNLERTHALDRMQWNTSIMGPRRWEDFPQFEWWRSRLEHAAGDVLHLPRPDGTARPHSPVGSASLRWDGHAVWIGPMTPEPWIAYSRVARLIDPDGRLQAWLRQSFEDLSARHDVRFVEVFCPVRDRPNLAARTPFVTAGLDPYGNPQHPQTLSLSGARLDNGCLRLPHVEQRVMPLFTSSALVGRSDRYARLLQLLWFQHGRAGLARDFPTFDRPATPRLALDDRVVLCPRRWKVPGDVLEATGAERYRKWRRFVRDGELPSFVYAFHGHHGTPELLATDSPLAVEMLEAPARLEEAPQPWLLDNEGHGHHAELVVSFKNRTEVPL